MCSVDAAHMDLFALPLLLDLLLRSLVRTVVLDKVCLVPADLALLQAGHVPKVVLDPLVVLEWFHPAGCHVEGCLLQLEVA